MATLSEVAVIRCIKELTEYPYQYEAHFCLRSRDLSDKWKPLGSSTTQNSVPTDGSCLYADFRYETSCLIQRHHLQII